MSTTRVILLVALLGAPAPIRAQTRLITGSIISAVDSQPVAEAHLRWTKGEETSRSDATGRFSIVAPRTGLPDSLTVRAIGFASRSFVIGPTASDSLIITLQPLPIQLPDLVAIGADPLVGHGGSEWRIAGTATRVTPAAVEPDAFRILRLIPAVSFSSFLSARPLLRGLNADDAGFAIDGYQAINLFHLGRMFSAFPALGVGAVRVSTPPADLSLGHTTSGRIAIDGAEWSADQRPELQYGLGAWSGRAGWRRSSSTGVLVGRTVQGAASGIAASGSSSLSLNLYDLYGRVDLGGTQRPLSLTVFRSLDRVNDADPDDGTTPAVLNWDNLIVGATGRLLDRGADHLVARVSYSSHAETAVDIPGRGTSVGVRNRLRRIGATIDGRLGIASHLALRLGGEVYRRELLNRLEPADVRRIPATAIDRRDTELATFGGAEWRSTNATVRAGVRIDHVAGVTVAQPRASLRLGLGSATWGAVTVGRASRLLHLISDARTEPKLAYYDMWLSADSATAAATTDNLSADIGWQRNAATFRVGVFASRGDGQIDFVPQELVSRDHPDLLRVGRVRTRGIEAEATFGTATGRWSGQFSYSLAWSDRNWGRGWVPWINDRRHVFRAAGVWRSSHRFFVSMGLELASGLPYTPWQSIDSSGAGPVARYGSENMARGHAVARLDLSAEKSFDGFGDTEMAIGFSLLNLAIGDQAPREALPPLTLAGRSRPMSRPMFTGVPVPSLLFRVRF